MIRSVVLASFASFLLAVGAGSAGAVNRDCPTGLVWDPGQGACIKKVKIKRKPLEMYYAAIEQLEGKSGAPDPARGASLLRQACEAKEMAACTLMGHVLMVGKSAADPRRAVAADASGSLRSFTRACDGGDAQGCLGVADVHARGLLGKVDQALATEALERACTMQNGRGCYRLAEQYEKGRGVKSDIVKARELYKKAFGLLGATCPASGPSCYLLGLAYNRGAGTVASSSKAFTAFESGCSAGSGEACFELGKAYFWGEGIKTDKVKAVVYYDRSCWQYDYALGCHDAGVTLVQGGDVPVDNARAQRFGDRACELDKQQCELRAYLIAVGPEPRDEAAAAGWYRVACENGNATGCYSLGARLASGLGVGKDQGAALAAFERACDGGHEVACRRLGLAHYNGESQGLKVTVDKVKAFRFFARACDNQDAEGCHWAGYLAEKGDGMSAVDDALAVRAYTKGCTLERGSSCEAVGRMAAAARGGLEAKAAREWWEKACNLRDQDACVNLGHRYYDGDGVDKDDLLAAGAFERACVLGAGRQCMWIAQLLKGANADAARQKAAVESLKTACKSKAPNPKACLALAGVYAYGSIAEKEPRAAFDLVKDACEQRKDQDACIELANYYMTGVGVVPNVEEGKKRYQEQCDAGMAASCTWLALQLYKEQKYEVAAQLFARACTEKHAQACTMIGFSHYAGQGVRWDVEAAAGEYQQGCELGDAVSCSNLGEIYEIGYARAKDLKKSLELYQKACTPTATSGCWAVGRFHERGWEVKVDLERAEREYRRACEADSGEACQSLAALLGKRGGKLKEIAKLNARAFELATLQSKSNPYGFYVLGRYYRDGVTVLKDRAKAAELFGKSCDGNEPQGCLSAGALAMERGRGGDKAGFEAASVYYDKGCAAGVDEACTEAAEARKLGEGTAPSPSPSLPGKVAPRAGGCGCRAGARTADASGASGATAALFGVIAMLGVLVVRGRSRRRARARRR